MAPTAAGGSSRWLQAAVAAIDNLGSTSRAQESSLWVKAVPSRTNNLTARRAGDSVVAIGNPVGNILTEAAKAAFGHNRVKPVLASSSLVSAVRPYLVNSSLSATGGHTNYWLNDGRGRGYCTATDGSGEETVTVRRRVSREAVDTYGHLTGNFVTEFFF